MKCMFEEGSSKTFRGRKRATIHTTIDREKRKPKRTVLPLAIEK